jgi:anti-sigma-K factor RskA
MTHVADLIDGYALGALDDAETRTVRDHLRDCAECSELLAEAREVLAALSSSLEPVEPGPEVRQRLVLAAIASNTAAPPVPAPVAIEGRRERRGPSWVPFAIAAGIATAAFAAALAWALVLNSRLDDKTERLATVEEALGAFAARGDTLHMDSEFHGNAIEAAIAVPEQEQQITVVVTGLPPVAAGEGYKLWLFSNGEPAAGVPLAPDENGNVVARLDIDLSQFDAMELNAQAPDDAEPGGELVIGGPLR